MKWEKKFNAIAKQMKTDASRITPQEWNFIINVLKEQANNNTQGVVYLNNKKIDIHQAGVDLEAVKTQVMNAIGSVEDSLNTYKISNNARVTSAEEEIDDIKEGATVVKKAEQDQDGRNIVSTYETIENANTQRALKVDKDLSAYDLITLADNQNIYVQIGSNYRRATIGNLKNFITDDFVSFSFVVVEPEDVDENGIPTIVSPLGNKIYLVLASEPDQDNVYNEFIWVNNNWELIGTTQVDLTNVVKGVIVDDLILNFDVNQRVKITNVIGNERDGLMSKADKTILDEIKSDIDLLYEEFIGGE